MGSQEPFFRGVVAGQVLAIQLECGGCGGAALGCYQQTGVKIEKYVITARTGLVLYRKSVLCIPRNETARPRYF